MVGRGILERMSPSVPNAPAGPARGFTTAKAESWVLASAMIVGAVYGFRRIIEPSVTTAPARGGKAAALLGAGSPPAALGQWAVAYSTSYIFLSIGAIIAPELAAALAMLIVGASLLSNGISVSTDLTTLEGGKKTAAVAPSSSPSATKVATGAVSIADAAGSLLG